MSSRRRVHDALGQFSHELRSFTTQLNEGVTVLKRVTDNKPTGGAREFREVLETLDTEVSDLSQEAEHLERFISGVISYEELLGHCLALYQTNRQLACKLEDHLQQFGYTKPSACEEEPEDPCSLAITSDHVSLSLVNAGASRDESDERDVNPVCTPLLQKTLGMYNSSMLPSADPVYKDSLYKASQDQTGPVRDQDVRTHQGRTIADRPQPVIHTDASCRKPAGAVLYAATPLPAQNHSFIGAGELCNTGSRYTSRLPGTASKKVLPRVSMDSHASSTPEAMMMSPSMTALLQKYANDSGSSVTPPSLHISGVSPLVEAGSSVTPEGLFDVDFALSMPPSLGSASPSFPVLTRAGSLQPGTRAPNCATPRKQGSHTSRSESGAAASGQVPLMRPPTTDPPTAATTSSLRGLDISAHQLLDSPGATPTMGTVSHAADVHAGGTPGQRTDPSTPGSTLRHARSMEHNRLLADRYAELEDLWVESGQAALTPVRNRPTIPLLAIPAASPGPPSQDTSCLTPGGRSGSSISLTPVGGRGRSAQSQIPSPAPAKGVIGGGFNPVHVKQTKIVSPRLPAATVTAGLQEPLTKSGAATSSLSMQLSQLHLAASSMGGGGPRTSVSPSDSLSPILAKPAVSRGVAKEAVHTMPLQHQQRSAGKPSARSALHFSMECESVSSLIIKSAAQGAAQAGKTGRAGTLMLTPGRSSSRIAARSAAANSVKPTTPGRSTPPPRQQQPLPSTSSTNHDTSSTWGSHAEEASSPAPLQRQQAQITRAATAKFSVDAAAVNEGVHARKGRASTPGPGKKVHQLYTIPISPVSSPPASPPARSALPGPPSPRLSNISAWGGARQHQQPISDTLTQIAPNNAQQRPSFGPRSSRPPTPHSAVSGRGEPMDIDDEAEEESSSPYSAPDQTRNPPPRHNLGNPQSSSQITPSGTPPVTPLPAFMLSQPAPYSGNSPATMTPPMYGARSGGVSNQTPNNTTSLWCDVPATPGGRRMSPGTSQLLSLAFGSDYAPLNLGYHGQVGIPVAAAMITHQQPHQHLPRQADPPNGNLPHRAPLPAQQQQQQRLSQPQRSVTPPIRISSKKQQAPPSSSVSPPNITHNPLRHSENFMAKLLKTTSTTGNTVNTNTSHSVARPSGGSSGKKLRASVGGNASTGGGLAAVSPIARLACLSGGGGGVGGSRSVAMLVPCREEEWSQLSSYIMHKLSCHQLNQQMERAYSVVEARCISQTSMGMCTSLTLSMEDLVSIGNTTATAKLIINAMVKLKRCAISSAGDRPGVMEYRVPAFQD